MGDFVLQDSSVVHLPSTEPALEGVATAAYGGIGV